MTLRFKFGVASATRQRGPKVGNAVMATRNKSWPRVAALVVCALIAGIAFSQSQGPVQPPKQPADSRIKPTDGIKVDVDLALVDRHAHEIRRRAHTGASSASGVW